MTKTENNILLFSITLCWAASYIFIKNLPENLSPYAYLTLTTGIAGILMVLIFFRKLRQLHTDTWAKGFLLSAILSINLLTERLGIARLSSANASFLSALTIIFVPLLLLFFHKKPTRNNTAGAILIVTGLAVSSGFHISGFYSAGTLYMLGTCLSSALYTIAVDRFSKEEDPLLLCMVQMLLTAAIGYVLWSGEDPATFLRLTYTRKMLSNLFVLAFFTKAFAYIVLMYAQKYTDAVNVTIIASTEPVVTLLLAYVLPAAYGGSHSLHASAAVGAVLITLGAIVAGLSFLSGKSAKEQRSSTQQVCTWSDKNVTIIRQRKQFAITLCAMLVLGISFKVMVLVEGLTEIRPVNAIPIVAGLVCGPVGAAACGIGNVLADFAGTLSSSSILGFVGNILAAYVPYRIWHLFSSKPPNVHSKRSIALYFWVSCLTSMLVAWILSFGLYLFWGVWMENIFTYVFWNDLGFSIGLGMPLLILLTSDDIGIICHPRPRPVTAARNNARRAMCIALFVLLSIITAAITAGHCSPEQHNWMLYSSAAAVLLLAGQLL